MGWSIAIPDTQTSGHDSLLGIHAGVTTDCAGGVRGLPPTYLPHLFRVDYWPTEVPPASDQAGILCCLS